MRFYLRKLLFRDINSNSQSSVDLASVKSRLQDTAYKSYSTIDNSLPLNLSKDEFQSLCNLKNENNLVIQKGDKANAIAILDKDSFLKSVETFWKDFSKLTNIPVVPDKDLN